MLQDVLMLHNNAAAVRTGNRFLEAFFRVGVGNACIRAFLSTMLAAVISVRTIFLEMFVEILPHELFNFVPLGQGSRVNLHMATCSSSVPTVPTQV